MRYLLAFLLVLGVRAGESVLELDPAHTQVHFTLGTMLHTVHGEFQFKRGLIRYDPASGRASGELVVDAASGQSGNQSRDKRMNKSILESDRYNEIVFLPDRVEGVPGAAAQAPVKLHGHFRIHGAEHEFTLPLQAQVEGGHFTARSGFTIPYVQWGLKNPSTFILRVNDKVEIAIETAGNVVNATTAQR